MKVYPSYYKDFKCINKACKHSCCIGWEIDIDPESVERFRRLGIKEGIDFDASPPCFVLDGDERCPYLDEEGLCRIIKKYGDEAVPEICREHPRFHNFLPYASESGIGLCCEEAARLILSQKEPFRLVCDGGQDGDTDPLTDMRNASLAILADREKGITERLASLAEMHKTALPFTDPKKFAELLLPLERLDESWTELLLKLRGIDESGIPEFLEYMKDRETEYEHFASYLLYRHYASADTEQEARARALFCAFGTLCLMYIGAAVYKEKGSLSFSEQTEIARLFSSEIEYSEENTEKLFDILL